MQTVEGRDRFPVRVRYARAFRTYSTTLFFVLCRRLLLVATLGAALPGLEIAQVEPAQPRCCARCGSRRLVYHELRPVAPASARLAAGAGQFVKGTGRASVV
jgi:hypothetical protein